MKNLLIIAVATAALFTAQQSSANIILPADQIWSVFGDINQQAPFGDSAPNGLPTPNTDWPLNTTLQLSTTLDLGPYDLSSVQYRIAIDNDYTLSVNGTQIGSLIHEGNAEWGPWLPLSNTISNLNTLDVTIVDRGGLDYFAMEVQGTPLGPVPDGGSALVLLSGSLALVGALRRRAVR